MPRRTTVRDEIDRVRPPVSPTDAPRLPQQDTAVALQTSIEAAQMHLEGQDLNLMEAGPRLVLARLALDHPVVATLVVAKFEN